VITASNAAFVDFSYRSSTSSVSYHFFNLSIVFSMKQFKELKW